MPAIALQPRKSIEEEVAEIVDEVSGMKKIFRELWDIRKANESIARTMESENV